MSYLGDVSRSTFAGLANAAVGLGVNPGVVTRLVDGRDLSSLLELMQGKVRDLDERPADPAAAALLSAFSLQTSPRAVNPQALLPALSELTSVKAVLGTGSLFSENAFRQQSLPPGIDLVDSILITNRGDPAIRAIRAIRAFNQIYGTNIKIGVIHSSVDKQDKFVGMADFSVEMPTAKKAEAFLTSLHEKLSKLSEGEFDATQREELIDEINAAKSSDIYFNEMYETAAIQIKGAPSLAKAKEEISGGIGKSKHPVTSYNNVEGILEALNHRKKCGERVGVFPGWGFLSERHDFVKALEDSDVCFFGPTAHQMEAMGHKRNCLVNMDGYGVPVGEYSERISNVEHGLEIAKRMNYPCMLKYSLGGGGTGNILLVNPEQARRALKEFFDSGKTDLFIENFIGGEGIEVAHLEFQVIGDGSPANDNNASLEEAPANDNDVLILDERECSLQRNNQKIFEGTASRIPIPERQKIKDAIRQALIAQKWRGASTVECLVAIEKDAEGKERYTAKFMEINTRVQVEHGTTEMAHGFDILHQLFLVCMGGKLTKRQSEVKKRSVTLEARILAENRKFESQVGKIEKCVFPEGPWVRVDSAVQSGSQVSPYFDSMIAKLIVEAPMRDYDPHDPEDMQRAEDEAYAVAVARMQAALDETHIVGLETNLELLRELSRTKEFKENKLNLSLVKKHVQAHPEPERPYMDVAVATAVAKAYLHEHKKVRQLFWSRDVATTDDNIPQSKGRNFTVYEGLKPLKARVAEVAKGRMEITLQDRVVFLDFDQIDDYTYRVRLANGQQVEIFLNQVDTAISLELAGVNYNFMVAPGDVVKDRNLLESPMQANIETVECREGDWVDQGQVVCVIESMKKYTNICAHQSGKVERVFPRRGLPVSKGAPLVIITPPASAEEIAVEPLKLDFKSFAEQDLLEQLKLAEGEENNKEKTIIESILKDLERYLPNILEEIKNYFLGYDYPKTYVNYLMILVETAWEQCSHPSSGEENSKARLTNVLSQKLTEVLEIAADLKGLFQEEYANDLYALRESNLAGNPVLSPKFDGMVANILKYYGVSLATLRDLPNASRVSVRNAFFRVFLSNREIDSRNNLLERFVKLSSHLGDAPTTALKDLAGVCGSFDPMRKVVLDVLAQTSPETYRQFVPISVGTAWIPLYDKISRNPFYDVSSGLDQAIASFDTSLTSVNGDTSRDHLPLEVRNFVREIESRQGVQARCVVHPGSPNVFQFALRKQGSALTETDTNSLESFATVAMVAPSSDRQATSIDYEKSFVEAARASQMATDLFHKAKGRQLKSNSVYVLNPAATDIKGQNDLFDQVGKDIKGFLQKGNVRSAYIVPLNTGEADGKNVCRYDLNGNQTIPPRQIPYEAMLKKEDAKTRYQHERGLMTVEERMEAFFGTGNYTELTVQTASGLCWPDKKTGQLKPCPQGVRIVKGIVDGKTVYAYFGDYRVSGGAFGIMEGLQQIYLFLRAYLDDGAPIIGFMDSGGANIYQDSLSLSFSAEDFLMKVVTGSEEDRDLFLRTIVNHADRELFDNLTREVVNDLSPDKINTRSKLQEKRLFQDFVRKYSAPLLALPLQVGTGIGMVIYGSALLPLEIMLQLMESYRCLTGERVRNFAKGEKDRDGVTGGALVHARKSGQAHDVAYTEEETFEIAKALLWLFHPGNRRTSDGALPKLGETWANGNRSIQRLFEKLDRRFFWPFMHDLEQGQALLSGFGKLGGVPVAILEAASETGFGTYDAVHKARKMFEAARSLKAPVIKIIGKRWIDTERSSDARAINERSKLEIESIRDPIPQFSIVTELEGVRALNAHSASDIKFFVRNDDVSDREIQRIMQAGFMIVETVEDALDRIKGLLPYHEKDRESRPVITPFSKDDSAHPLKSDSQNLNKLMPADHSESYDPIPVIQEIVDKDTFQEIWPDIPGEFDSHSRLVVGFARTGGIPVLVIADNTMVEGAAATAIGAEKFEKAVALAEKMGLQIVCLNDAPGFNPEAAQEKRNIQGAGADSIKRNIRFTRGAVTVTHRGYGGRWIQALHKYLNAVTYSIALKGSEIAVMGPEGALAALDDDTRKKREWVDEPGLPEDEYASRRKIFREFVKMKAAQKRADNHGNPEQAYKSGAIDVIASKENLRMEVYLGVVQAQILAETAHRRDFNTMTSDELTTAKVVAVLEGVGLKTSVVGQVRRRDTVRVTDRLDDDVHTYQYLKAREPSYRDGFTGEYDIGFIDRVLSAYGTSALSAEGIVAFLDTFTGQGGISDDDMVAIAQARGALTTFLSVLDESLFIDRNGSVTLNGEAVGGDGTQSPEDILANHIKSFVRPDKSFHVETLVRQARLFEPRRSPTRVASAA